MVVRESAIYIAPVKPGEKYERNYKYAAYSGTVQKTTEDGELIYVPDPDKIAEAGEYEGTFKINICGPDPDHPYEGITSYSMDFSITVR